MYYYKQYSEYSVQTSPCTSSAVSRAGPCMNRRCRLRPGWKPLAAGAMQAISTLNHTDWDLESLGWAALVRTASAKRISCWHRLAPYSISGSRAHPFDASFRR